MPEPAQIVYLITPILVFILVLAAWCMVVVVYYMRSRSHKERLDSRIGLGTAPRREMPVASLWHERERAAGTRPSARRRLSFQERMERILRDAGLTVPLRTALAGLCGGTLLLWATVMVFSGSWLLAAGVSAAALVSARSVMRWRTNRWSALFETQLVDALDLAARSLQAGHPSLSAFRIISENIPPPVGTFFAEICQQQALGAPLEEAIQKTAAESSNPDVGIFATSVVIQRRTGGDLSPTIERLALVIRGRISLSRRIRVLTAQTQFSKRVLLALPVLMFVLLNLLNPQYMQPLYSTEAGKVLLSLAGASTLLGAWTMNRMATLHY